MKNTLLILLAVLTLTLVSCKKDKDENNDSNGNPALGYMEYDGQTYGLTSGFIIEYGLYKKGDVYEFDIYMYSGMNVYNPDSVSGSGNIIGFCIYSENSKIDPGTYVYSSGYGEPFTYCYGHFQLKYQEGWHWIDIGDGNLSISIGNNNEFDVTFECTVDNGKPIKGRYVGTPLFHEYEWKGSQLISILN